MHVHVRRSIRVLVALLALLPAQVRAAAEPRPLGCRPMTADEEARVAPRLFRFTGFPRPAGVSPAPLPAAVKNTLHLPAVGDQGSIGSCSAFATCYYLKTHQEAKEHGWVRPNPAVDPGRVASPAFAYNTAYRTWDEGGGTSPFALAQSMCDFGIGTWEDMPYSDPMDFGAWPSEAAWKNGARWRGRQVGEIAVNTDEGLRAMKEWLAAGNLGVFIIGVYYQGLDEYPSGPCADNGVLYRDIGALRGLHAVAVVGYDDTRTYFDEGAGVTKQGAFLCVNSWGPGFGVVEETVGTGGFFWLSYEYFRYWSGANCGPALIMDDRTDYEPSRFAVIGVDHPTGGVLDMTLTGGDPASPLWERTGWPFADPMPIAGRTAVDLTDYDDIETLTVFLRVVDPSYMNKWPDPGTVTYFALQGEGGEPLPSSDTPTATVKNRDVFLRAGVFSDAGIPFDGLKIWNGSGVAADFTGDGRTDVFIAGRNIAGGGASVAGVFANNGDGTFAALPSGIEILTHGLAAAADFDNDGLPDIALVGYPAEGQPRARIYRNAGGGAFTPATAETAAAYAPPAWGDYNNDGRPDVVLPTETGTLLLRNDGAGVFTDSGVLFPVVGTPAWADFDGDGWLDLVVAGSAKTALYRNGRNGTFAEVAAGLPAVGEGAVAWADFDGDGRLDLAISGTNAGASLTRVYRNLGDGSFADTGSSLTAVHAGALVWGDADSDGRIDLLATGREIDWYPPMAETNYPESAFPNRTRVYRNDGTGRLRDSGARITDLSSGFAAAFDYDGDGDLDYLLSGTRGYLYSTTPSRIYTGIHRSAVSSPSGLDRPNTPPAPPSGLSADAGWEDGSVVLRWGPGSDAETSETALAYAVRVGTAPGGGSVLSGFLPVADRSFQRTGRSLPLGKLAAGTYYWSVRTIDAARVLSAWSGESSFSVGSHTRTYDLVITSADPARGTTDPTPGTHARAAGTAAPVTALPASSYAFDRWTGPAADPAAASTTVSMTADRAVTAFFKTKYPQMDPAWTELTGGAPWSGRQMAATAVFNGEIWILGGATAMGASREVWRSSNGVSWTQAPTPGWSARYGHAAAVFDDKLWVLGGYDASGARNDAWWTADGTSWTEAETPGWSARSFHAALVFGGKLWVLGGSGPGTLGMADVWWTADGTTWTQAVSGAWPGRYGHAAAVFDGKLWVFGGASGYTLVNDVWSSADGASWTRRTEHAEWSPRYGHSCSVLGNALWLLGGIDFSGAGALDELWFSFDGIHWTRTETAPACTGRSFHGAVAFGGGVVVLGGDANGLARDIWRFQPGSLPAGVRALTVAVSPAGSGTTTPSVGVHFDDAGTLYTVAAVPNAGYRFVDWSGPVADPNAAATSVTVAADTIVTANFASDPATTYTLSIAASPAAGGTVSPSPGPLTYPAGTVVGISAVPAFNYVFSGWTGDVADPSSLTTTVAMNGDRTVRATFAPEPFSMPVRIAGGRAHAVFLHPDGTVWTWGTNDAGQLGDSTAAGTTAPGAYAVLTGAKAVAAGARFTAALKTDGTVWTWGANDRGQLGAGLTGGSSAAPVQVKNLSGVKAIACGGNHAVALKTDGTVWTWGANDFGQCGANTGSDYYPYYTVPVQVKGEFSEGVLSGVAAVAAGGGHTLAVRGDGVLFAWGRNSSGELGVGGYTSRRFPVRVPGLAAVRAVACGGAAGGMSAHSLAVLSDGSVRAWGADDHGQLGNGADGASPVPVRVRDAAGTGWLAGVTAVAAGERHGIARLSDGSVAAWGWNAEGQLGDGTRDDRALPGPVAGVSGAVSVAAGARHGMALLGNETLVVWGGNGGGQLGIGTTEDALSAAPVAGLDGSAANVGLVIAASPAAGGTTRPAPGAYRCRPGSTARIVAVPAARYRFKNWSGDAAGTETAVLVAMDGDRTATAVFELQPGIQCALTVSVSPPGAGTTVPAAGATPCDVGSVVNISATPGYRHLFDHWEGPVANAAAAATSVAMNGDTAVTAVFAPVPFEARASVACGAYHTMVLKSDSTVWTFGDNTGGKLGDGTTTVPRWPVQVLGAGGTGYLSGVVGVEGGYSFSLAVLNDGTLLSWGDNSRGQLGVGPGNPIPRSLVPVAVLDAEGTGPLSGIVAAVGGGNHAAALRYDGTLWTWGENTAGQLGDNTNANRDLPVRVKGEWGLGSLPGAVAIGCGSAHTLAVLADGTVRAWGANDGGQLGNGTLDASPVPVPVAGLSNVRAVSGGSWKFSVALKNDGTVWTWGSNNYGQLGNNTSVESSLVPVQVKGPGGTGFLTGITAIAAGYGHVLALKNDGTVWAWGSNIYYGQLGTGTSEANSPVPVQVLGENGVGFLTGVVAIAAGYSHSAALKSDGTLWVWGYNENGQFGGTFGYQYTRSSTPVYVNEIAPGDPAVTMHTLTVKVAPSAGGTTVPAAGIHTYNPGNTVYCSARPAAGYLFASWSGPVADRSSPVTTLTVAGSATVTAYFERSGAEIGDINRDGVVDVTDVLLSLRMAIDLPLALGGLSEEAPYATGRRALADFNADGMPDIADTVGILGRAAGRGLPPADPYQPREPVPPETEPETSTASVPAGADFDLDLTDGTRVEGGGLPVGMTLSLSRETTTVGLDAFAQETSGSMRTLVVTTDATVTETDAARLMPVLTIPQGEVGALNPETLNIVRITEEVVDGRLETRYAFLPIFRDRYGRLTTRDVFISRDLLARQSQPAAGGGGRSVTVRYVPSTFQGNVNWLRPAKLVRMVPMRLEPGDEEKECAARRIPMDSLPAVLKTWEEKKPVQNVVVLVHGHNEEEKAGVPGTYNPDIDAPWYFSYKRDVWTHLYDIFLREYPEFNGGTVFYEFVYPTWRPVFDHLDDAFAAALEEALAKQLDPANNAPFNLFVVAHSMGGLVARAGLQKIGDPLDARFKRLATWGSPHHGSALTTFRYAMCSPYYRLGKSGVVLRTWVHDLIRSSFDNMCLDTPGTSDLRWTNGPASSPRYTTLDSSLFEYDMERIEEDFGSYNDAVLNLRYGTALYNQNLAILNAFDTKGDRYTAMYGITEKGLDDDAFSGGVFDSAIAGYDFASMSDIAKGATMNRLLIENGHVNYYLGFKENRSDGAVPVISEAAMGIAGETYFLGDADHEEYFNLTGKAEFTARRTFEVLGFKTKPEYDSPTIEFVSPAKGELLDPDEDKTVTVRGRIVWPGHSSPGDRVKPNGVRIYLLSDAWDIQHGYDGSGAPATETGDNPGSDGGFSATFTVARADAYHGVKVVVSLKDGTELHGMVELGSPVTRTTAINGESIVWTIDGMERVFYFGDFYDYTEIFFGQEPAAGTPVFLSASIAPAHIAQGYSHQFQTDVFGAVDKVDIFWSNEDPEVPAELTGTLSASSGRSYDPAEYTGLWVDYAVGADIMAAVSIGLVWNRDPMTYLPPYAIPPP